MLVARKDDICPSCFTGEYDHWVIYISASGKVGLQSIRDILHGEPADQRVAEATILDIGLDPVDLICIRYPKNTC
jgi:hypothetical protein